VELAGISLGIVQVVRRLPPEQVLYEESSMIVEDKDSENAMRKSTIRGLSLTAGTMTDPAILHSRLRDGPVISAFSPGYVLQKK
jgi:hypothetical protein